MTYCPGRLPAVVTSVYVMTGAASQLSVAVAAPVNAGSLESWHVGQVGWTFDDRSSNIMNRDGLNTGT